jgi:hypothetical protein
MKTTVENLEGSTNDSSEQLPQVKSDCSTRHILENNMKTTGEAEEPTNDTSDIGNLGLKVTCTTLTY